MLDGKRKATDELEDGNDSKRIKSSNSDDEEGSGISAPKAGVFVPYPEKVGCLLSAMLLVLT